MNGNYMMLLPIIIPMIAGLIVGFAKPLENRKTRMWFVGSIVLINGLLTLWVLGMPEVRLEVFHITKDIPILFKIDGVSKLFAGLVSVMWTATTFFSFEYMKHEKNEERYFAFFLVTLGVLIGIGFSGNLVTLYMLYEAMTLVSMPLVLHSLTKEAIRAGLKYMFYSICGAALALLGIFYLNQYATTLEFTPGGVLDLAKVAENKSFFLVIIFLMLIGFGTKAGMFPLQGWLPTAHPVAPAPASAVMSGVITKAGVVAIIRVVFYLVGADFIRGTWVQTAWMSLALITVFLGSMLAYKEQILKKRLAFSSVSQVSYILFGLSVLNVDGVLGGMMHIVFHSLIKDALFLVAGVIIYKTGKTKVSELRGIGKEMPITMWCYTLVSLALIGIPPMSGFVSKWYLAIGSLQSDIPVLSWLGPVVLLVSALLTAGYLLPITIKGFFPGADYDYSKLEKKEPNMFMTVPIVALTIGAVIFGMFPTAITDFITGIVSTIL